MWVKSWLLKRNKFGHDRLVTELRLTSAADNRNYLRMDAATFSELLEMIPASEREWKDVAQQFERRWNFPNCIGAIDGKHINIRKPPGSGSYYFNYKNSFSVVLMAVVNANYEFIMVDVGANGRVSDGVFSNMEFYKRLVSNKLHIPQPDDSPNCEIKQPYVFVADDAFPLMDSLIKPFSRKNLTREQTIFNYRLSRARRIVENAFGILASRFRILLREINLGPEKASLIVLACTHLHNCLRMKKEDSYNHGGFDVENTNTLLLPLQQLPGRNTPVSSKQVRLNFSQYFNSEQGAVSW
ncbi:hypothetical protein JTB14_008837 [Gonioctena quinquepunctata]|nr:hypothetical protein JTB14_008837 [Gonioctena quinquepunctata]